MIDNRKNIKVLINEYASEDDIDDLIISLNSFKNVKSVLETFPKELEDDDCQIEFLITLKDNLSEDDVENLILAISILKFVDQITTDENDFNTPYFSDTIDWFDYKV